MGEPTRVADEQNTETGDGPEGEHTEAAVATKPWTREVPRNWTTGKADGKGVSSVVPDGGANVAVAAVRKARAHTGRACAGLTP